MSEGENNIPLNDSMRVEVVKTLALRRKDAKQYTEAVEAFRWAVVLDRSDPDLWFGLGVCLVELGQHDEAIVAFQEGIRITPRVNWAWDYTGYIHKLKGRFEEAARCFNRSTEIAPDSDYAWKRLGECYEALGDQDKRLIALRQVVRCSPSDVEAWCTLARAHEDNHAVSSALGAYSRAIRIKPRDPGPLLAVADAFVRQNYTLDAAHALRQVLRLEPANRKANALLPIFVVWLQPRAQCIEQYAQSSPACSTPYEIYLNPFELLDYRIPSLSEWDDAAARRAKKRMLAELDLNDGRLPWLGGARLDRSRALSTADDLDSIERRQLHFLVFRCKRLLRFLTHGDLRFFAYDATPNANLGLLLPRETDNTADFLGECFAKQYDRQLAHCLTSSQPLLLEALSSRHLPVSTQNLDACYTSAYARLQQLKGDIAAKSSSVSNSLQAARDALAFLKERFSAECLNALPSYFRDIRSEIAVTIRGMSIECYNAHQDAALSKEMLAVATSLATNERTKAKLDSDVIEIAEIATCEKENTADFMIGKKKLLIDRHQVVFGNRSTPTSQITGIRWGIFREYTNGSRTSCSYLVSVSTTQGTSLDMECHKSRFFSFGKDEQDSLARFQAVLKSCFANIVPQIVQMISSRLNGGETLPVGQCQLDREGLHFTTGVLFWKTERFISWRDVAFDTQNGMVIVYDPREPKCATSMSAREMWNAVLLEYIASSMRTQ